MITKPGGAKPAVSLPGKKAPAGLKPSKDKVTEEPVGSQPPTPKTVPKQPKDDKAAKPTQLLKQTSSLQQPGKKGKDDDSDDPIA